MALYEFFRKMIFGTDLSPKKIILKGANLIDPYLTQFQFKVELENALMTVYAHPEQMDELRSSLALAGKPLEAVHNFIQGSLRKQDSKQLGEAATLALKKMLEELTGSEREFQNGIRSAWASLLHKMQSEASKNTAIRDWLKTNAALLD